MRRCVGAWRFGVTLLELVLVIAVAGLLTVSAVGVVTDTLANYRLNAAATKLVSDMRYAQEQARARSIWYGVSFAVNPTNTYTVYQTDGTHDTTVTDPSNRAATLVASLFTGFRVQITAASIGGGAQVEFSPDGTPYVDKTGAVLAANGSVTLTCGNKTRTVQIVKGTGRVEVL